jgi:antitoxin component YwqK of YwqJK toxin-antitoxin module
MNKFQISFIVLLFTISGFAQKKYQKEYYSNGNLKAEGWLLADKKSNYWYFYNSNGDKKEEGHFKNNQKTSWWIFYDSNQKITKKCEFQNNLPSGLCLLYTNGKIQKAEKYTNGKIVKTWTNLSQFIKDNNI